jgi:hypothetical protein
VTLTRLGRELLPLLQRSLRDLDAIVVVDTLAQGSDTSAPFALPRCPPATSAFVELCVKAMADRSAGGILQGAAAAMHAVVRIIRAHTRKNRS